MYERPGMFRSACDYFLMVGVIAATWITLAALIINWLDIWQTARLTFGSW